LEPGFGLTMGELTVTVALYKERKHYEKRREFPRTDNRRRRTA
jgi:hypothetical protein